MTDDHADTVAVTDLPSYVAEFLAANDPAQMSVTEFLGARFDAGLAWVHNPVGSGGLGLDAAAQAVVDGALAAAGAPGSANARNVIGLGMAAPTISLHGTEQQRRQWLRPCWASEEIWCQLFSEPGAGSDLASLATRAVPDGTDWIVNGQKVWTSLAHEARWALLIARTDPTVPKHKGLTYFVCDMTAPGIEVRPLRQITGEAEFNEVFLDNVRVPDSHRLGDVGAGWKVTQSTLMNERVAIGAARAPRESGAIGALAALWRSPEAHRTIGTFDQLLRLWVEAETMRLTTERLRQQAVRGTPGPEGSGAKLAFASLAQRASSLELDVLGGAGMRYDDWSFRRPDLESEGERPSGYRYLRTKANSIEGGTSEIMRNIIAERILGLPSETRADVTTPWNELAR
ncbi:acyl-CoA dehydrogenase family protein [Jongsikchunia kroppenstedtii]|uniref:acyl-CoA dehydrogenase family protein n=1 Tax=Jongsikchunia kroppenstedtii TaxID=1121721 RepID=UPI000378D752|nr:acyl-CoA dehydrogenase family protein [Jongsikchunia kroppenstedtii]